MDRKKIENDLLNSGFTDMQSESLSYIIAEMSTKEDIRELRSDMTSEFRAVRVEMASEFRAVREEMQVMRAELRADIAESSKQMMDALAAFQSKLFTHALGMIAALTAIMTLLLLLFR